MPKEMGETAPPQIEVVPAVVALSDETRTRLEAFVSREIDLIQNTHRLVEIGEAICSVEDVLGIGDDLERWKTWPPEDNVFSLDERELAGTLSGRLEFDSPHHPALYTANQKDLNFGLVAFDTSSDKMVLAGWGERDDDEYLPTSVFACVIRRSLRLQDTEVHILKYEAEGFDEHEKALILPLIDSMRTPPEQSRQPDS